MTLLVYHEDARYAGTKAIEDPSVSFAVTSMLVGDRVVRDAGCPIHKTGTLLFAEVAPGLHLFEWLYVPEKKTLGHDLHQALILAIDQSVEVDQAAIGTATHVGQLGLFNTGSQQQLNCENDWLALARAELLANPPNLGGFLGACKTAFPRLLFSEDFPDCLETFDGGYEGNIHRLFSCLQALNDHWKNATHESPLPDQLRKFQAIAGYPTSLEGSKDRHDAITFTFRGEAEVEKRVLCEPHVKIGRSDVAGDSSYHFHRLYFSAKGDETFPSKVLIGHAGKHL